MVRKVESKACGLRRARSFAAFGLLVPYNLALRFSFRAGCVAYGGDHGF